MVESGFKLMFVFFFPLFFFFLRRNTHIGHPCLVSNMGQQRQRKGRGTWYPNHSRRRGTVLDGSTWAVSCAEKTESLGHLQARCALSRHLRPCPRTRLGICSYHASSWHACRKRKRHHEHTCTEKKPHEDTAKRWPSARQGERLGGTSLASHWSWTSSL